MRQIGRTTLASVYLEVPVAVPSHLDSCTPPRARPAAARDWCSVSNWPSFSGTNRHTLHSIPCQTQLRSGNCPRLAAGLELGLDWIWTAALLGRRIEISDIRNHRGAYTVSGRGARIIIIISGSGTIFDARRWRRGRVAARRWST